MKTCSKCKVEKDEAEFSKKIRNKDGLDSRCKACWREYWQTDAYKERHRKNMKEYQQTDAHKEYMKAYQQTDAYKDYREAYKEYQKSYQKAYRQTDVFKASQKAYRQTDARKASRKAYNLRKKAADSAGNAAQSGDTQTIGAKE